MARTAVDLFCGSGGVTSGLKRRGWHVLAAVDIDPIASATYKANHPEVGFIQADISSKDTIKQLRKSVGDSKVDLLVVCAPCQPFSSQNRHRGDDERESLIIKAVAAIRELKPILVFFENVPGLASPAYEALVGRLLRSIRRAGYRVSGPSVEDAADYGVPQRRRRCIMLAAREHTHLARFEKSKKPLPRLTVREAIGDLPRLKPGQRSDIDPLHFARDHAEIAVARLRAIPHDGGSRASLPPHLQLACHKDQRGFPDVYGRMKWADVAPTLTTGCTDVTRGRFAHPSQDRAITLREAARLQSFSDDYKFHGNAGQVATQIGNAVPPAMISALVPAFEAAIG